MGASSHHNAVHRFARRWPLFQKKPPLPRRPAAPHASHVLPRHPLAPTLHASPCLNAPRPAGDVLAVLPRTPPGDVEALLARLRLDGDRRVRVELYDPQRHGAAAGEGAHGDGGGAAGNGHVADVEARGGGVEAGAWCEATVQDLVQGALDVAGASPRRYFFQVRRCQLTRFARGSVPSRRAGALF